MTTCLSLGGGSSSVRRDLVWEPEGCRFKSHTDHSMERGLVVGEVPVHLLALLPRCPWARHRTPNCSLAPLRGSLSHLSLCMFKFPSGLIKYLSSSSSSGKGLYFCGRGVLFRGVSLSRRGSCCECTYLGEVSHFRVYLSLGEGLVVNVPI